MKIGLSLSFCVRDIVEGRVNIGDVERIVTGTCAETYEEWCTLLDHYVEGYWYEYPQKALSVVSELRSKGMISQPRLQCLPIPSIADGHWKEVV